jgi:hypothetical protein
MRPQRAASREPSRHGAQEAAQGRDHGLVGRRARAGGTAQELHVGRGDDLLGEARLPGARLAGEQDERAAAVARLGERALEPGPLGFALDERAVAHRRSLRTADRSPDRSAGRPDQPSA